MKRLVRFLVVGLLVATSVAIASPRSPLEMLSDSRLTQNEIWDTLKELSVDYEALSDEGRESASDFQRTVHQVISDQEVDAAMDLAYTFHGLSKTPVLRSELPLDLLKTYEVSPKVESLRTFFGHRSVHNAAEVIKHADSPRSLAVGYMCMAEAQYAKGDISKAIMSSILSLAYDFYGPREKQALLYITGKQNSSLSLKGEKQEVIERLLSQIKGITTPKTFRRYYTASSVISLLSQFPYSSELLSKERGEPLHICIGFDGNYSYHGAVTMLSAMLSADPSTRYIFHVPEDAGAKTPIPEHHFEKLRSQLDFFPQGRFEIAFEKYGEEFIPETLRDREFRHWPRGILFKLYIPKFYSHLNRIMWLDSDLLVRADLTPFYIEDIGENWIMAVRDLDALQHLPRLRLDMDDSYVNAGVMLYDVDKLHNKEALVETCLSERGEEKGFLRLPEQDIYAVAYRGHIKENSFQFWTERPIYFELGAWNWFYFPKHKKASWKELHNHYAKIIHMAANSRKPWNRKSSPFWWAVYPKAQDGVQNLYWTLRSMGPWPVN